MSNKDNTNSKDWVNSSDILENQSDESVQSGEFMSINTSTQSEEEEKPQENTNMIRTNSAPLPRAKYDESINFLPKNLSKSNSNTNVDLYPILNEKVQIDKEKVKDIKKNKVLKHTRKKSESSLSSIEESQDEEKNFNSPHLKKKY